MCGLPKLSKQRKLSGCKYKKRRLLKDPELQKHSDSLCKFIDPETLSKDEAPNTTAVAPLLCAPQEAAGAGYSGIIRVGTIPPSDPPSSPSACQEIAKPTTSISQQGKTACFRPLMSFCYRPSLPACRPASALDVWISVSLPDLLCDFVREIMRKGDCFWNLVDCQTVFTGPRFWIVDIGSVIKLIPCLSEDFPFMLTVVLLPRCLCVSPCPPSFAVTTWRMPFLGAAILDPLPSWKASWWSTTSQPSLATTTTHRIQDNILLVSAHPTIITHKPKHHQNLTCFSSGSCFEYSPLVSSLELSQVPPSEPKDSLQVSTPETIIYVLFALAKPFLLTKPFL